jgi:Flp pilus assembly protein TadD
MRARTEGKQSGVVLGVVVAAVWLWGGQAWAQSGKPIPPERIQETYRKILSDWSAGESDKAPDELIELETAVAVDTDAGSRKILLKAEQEVIHQIGAADLEVLVPIAVLHHEAYRRLLERGSRGRALAMIHTRNMAKDLALLYSEQSGSEGAAVVASRILTSIGGLLLQSAQQLPAAELFQKAAELDGRNIPALLALATVYEKNTQAESAGKLLRRVLEVDPANGEARLRLAMILKRSDQDGEARQLLESLTRDKDATWVTPLGIQELARLHAEGGRTSEAEKILRAAVERFPDDLRLRIQLAAVLDRRGAAGEATAMVEKALAAKPATEGEVSASRYLYNAARPEEFAEIRTFLEENSKSRLQVLAQALGAPVEASGTGVGR